MRELTDLIAERGRPKMIVSDNRTELTSNAVLAWCGDVGVEWHYIALGKPTQNGFIESVHEHDDDGADGDEKAGDATDGEGH